MLSSASNLSDSGVPRISDKFYDILTVKNQLEKLGVKSHTCIPRLENLRQEEEVQGHPEVHSRFEANLRLHHDSRSQLERGDLSLPGLFFFSFLSLCP